LERFPEMKAALAPAPEVACVGGSEVVSDVVSDVVSGVNGGRRKVVEKMTRFLFFQRFPQ
jgi:hypothetical protein